jgi:hypothetical protein
MVPATFFSLPRDCGFIHLSAHFCCKFPLLLQWSMFPSKCHLPANVAGRHLSSQFYCVNQRRECPCAALIDMSPSCACCLVNKAVPACCVWTSICISILISIGTQDGCTAAPALATEVNGITCSDPFLAALVGCKQEVAERVFKAELQLRDDYGAIEKALQAKADDTARLFKSLLTCIQVRRHTESKLVSRTSCSLHRFASSVCGCTQKGFMTECMH